MDASFIFILLASTFFRLGNECAGADHGADVVNVAVYEVQFHELFQQYWHNNRTMTKKLNEILQIVQQPHTKLEEYPNIDKPDRCLTCRAFSYTMLNYYRNDDSNLYEYVFLLCKRLMEFADHICRGLVNIYGPSLKYILRNRNNELSSKQICGIVQSECSDNPYVMDFTIQLDQEPPQKTPKRYNFAENSSDVITIAHLSDFHYDPFYTPGSSSQCTEVVCCRNTSIPKSNSTSRAGYWGDYHKCDTPGHLVENICSHVAANHKNIDWIYYTGDFADHFTWETSRASVTRTIEFITQQIKEKFPNTPVFMTIGNHDCHPADAFAPEIVGPPLNSRWLYEAVAELWSQWLPQSALSTLRTGGYYTVKLHHRQYNCSSGLRVIVLNNNVCWIQNIWLHYGPDEMITQLEWLRDTLILAEMNREKVHIIGHVPPYTTTCVKVWNREYNRLVRRFAHIISGQFNGHTHKDSFTVFYSNDYAPVNVAWNGGSGTSFPGVNSNYRTYTVEPNTFEVIDFDTYIFNLTAANLTPDQPPKWFKEYGFRDAFGIADLSPHTLSHLANHTFRYNRQALHKMWSFYHKMSDAEFAKGCNDACLENLRLNINSEHEDNFF